MLLKKIFSLVTLLFCLICSSQKNIDYSIYGYNLNLIDPSFSGQEKVKKLLVNSKVQWLGVEQPPITNTILFSMPLKNNLGLGVSILDDRTFLFNETTFAVDGSYGVKFNETHNLKFGLRAQGNIYSGDLSKVIIQDKSDPLYTNTKTHFNPNFSIGLSFNSDRYYTSFVVNKLLKDKRHSNMNYKSVVNYYSILFGGGYTFKIDEGIDLTPSALLKFNEGSVFEFDVSTRVKFKNKYNLGLSYYWKNSLQLNGLFEAFTGANVGYAYRFFTNDLGINYGTHEFMLMLDLDKFLTNDSNESNEIESVNIN